VGAREPGLAEGIQRRARHAGRVRSLAGSGLSLWAKANLDAAGYKGYVEALAGTNAASVFKTIEAITAKARQPARAKPGDVVGDEPVSPLAEIQALQAKVNPATGKRFYEEDAAYRMRVEKKLNAYFAAQQQ
jgi:hypothetical protein